MSEKKTKKISSPKSEYERLLNSLEERYARWHHIHENGCNDPTWSDGCNMNLVRNHIINYKRQLKTLCEEHDLELPEVYHRELPTEVDSDFMANTELIDENARKALSILESHPDYLELLDFGSRLSPKQKDKIFYNTVVGYVSRLRDAIENHHYIHMRCFSRHENYVESFVNCLAKAKAMEPEQYQLSLFDAEAS